jgi:hypothetical protein
MNPRHFGIVLAMTLVSGCYHSLAPSIGYTLDHGLTYGMSYSGGYGYAGTNSGFVHRPSKAGGGSENIGYTTLALSTLGVVEAGAGVGVDNQGRTRFAGIINGLPIKPIRFLDNEPNIRFSPTVGVRYLGEAMEFYFSPRLYFVDTGGRH